MLHRSICKFARVPFVWLLVTVTHAQTVTASNLLIRVAAANLSSGNNQRYETPGLNILKGLKPDIVCIQEFNYSSSIGNGLNTTAAFRELLDNTFGTNFNYYRESGNYNIPNGIISRWPISSSGSWDDPNVSDRGFAWAQVNLPGTNDLYVVSVHLWSSGTATQRGAEAALVKSNILANFPLNAWVIVGGDFNTATRAEAAVDNFKTLLSDSPIPTDKITGGDPDTNEPRNKPYDYVMPSFSLTNNQVPVIIGTNRFTNGLVFDSRVYSPLGDVAPVQSTDSGAVNMQHMAVVKDFLVSYGGTNVVNVAPPVLSMKQPGVLVWSAPAGITCNVQGKIDFSAAPWILLGVATSSTTNYSYTNNGFPQLFFRVVCP